jgi:predicted Zn-dependent protease with MMP-like domain
MKLPPWTDLLAAAREEVRLTLDDLPEPLRRQAQNLPVTYERRPNPGLQLDGVEPDTLGLFVGEPFDLEGQTSAPMPAQIMLFLHNLWDFAEGDMEIFLDETHATYLHELGHYLGLDESDLEERGLE